VNFDAYPTKDEIERALVLQEEYDRSEPQSVEEAGPVVDRIYADLAAAHAAGRPVSDPISHVWDVANEEPVTRKDRGEVRAFWSYESQPEGAPRPVRHRFLAQACGETRGLQVLEETPAGSRLDTYHLWNEHVQTVLIQEHGLDPKAVRQLAPKVWDTLSERYAKAAEVPVVAFAADIGAGSVLGKTEMPRLLTHEKVGKDNIRFPLPLPRHEHLPPEIDELIADEAIRAQVRMEDFANSKSPKEFARSLGDIDVPEHLRESHASAVQRLELADSYEALAAQPTEPQRAAVNEFLPGVDVRPVARPAAPRGPTPLGHGVLNPAAALTLPPPPAPEQQPAGVER
jgi:hypothetical protein